MSDYLLLPLHSVLLCEDQRRIVLPAPDRTMKASLATNICASCSVTNDAVTVTCRTVTELFTSDRL